MEIVPLQESCIEGAAELAAAPYAQERSVTPLLSVCHLDPAIVAL